MAWKVDCTGSGSSGTTTALLEGATLEEDCSAALEDGATAELEAGMEAPEETTTLDDGTAALDDGVTRLEDCITVLEDIGMTLDDAGVPLEETAPLDPPVEDGAAETALVADVTDEGRTQRPAAQTWPGPQSRELVQR